MLRHKKITVALHTYVESGEDENSLELHDCRRLGGRWWSVVVVTYAKQGLTSFIVLSKHYLSSLGSILLA